MLKDVPPKMSLSVLDPGSLRPPQVHSPNGISSVHPFFSRLTVVSRPTDYTTQDDHSPGKPGKVGEFQNGQGKVRENEISVITARNVAGEAILNT